MAGRRNTQGNKVKNLKQKQTKKNADKNEHFSIFSNFKDNYMLKLCKECSLIITELSQEKTNRYLKYDQIFDN